ncbi:uncharacterized protein LOC134533943 isoform X2 [Bacillus rossius redtenbacheri]|uniref:uncharacterized protein LOC134533943 isoform X2 n=1 Tax=Bacillus rossius redtenbacheri TaxID=93214 RepID=UPI002FDDB723
MLKGNSQMSENGELLNETPSESEKMDISEISDHPSPESDESPGEAVDNQASQGRGLDNAPAPVTAPSATGTASTAGRQRLDSALSLEGLDLELPPLDAYQEEYVDFPSSPKHLKECFEANGVALPLEGDSGTAGRSEDEDEEDTSIYQAVLSPDCRDVRLRKERIGDALETTRDIIEAILAEDDSNIEDADGTPRNEGSGTGLGAEYISRRLVMPNLHELSLSDVYNSDGRGPNVRRESTEAPGFTTPPPADKTESGRHVLDENGGFIMESHDSSLSRQQNGSHVIKGLFFESPLRNMDSRRVLAPERDLLDSPKEEEESENPFREPARQPMVDKKDAVLNDCEEVGNSKTDDYGVPVPSPRTKPVPKTRTVMADGSGNSSSQERGPVLVLDPSKLDLKLARRTPQISDDGSVEKLKERPGTLVPPQRGGRRKIRVSEDILQGPADEGDASSGESRLSDTDMVSPDDADLDELLSPGLDTPDEMEDSIMERLSESLPPAEPIPELSAAEEKAEARNWRSCVIAGLERRIDMKVIEPYKRVLSHGGYLNEGSHNAIIVFSACYLPDRSRVDYDYVMDNLFLYVLTTLDQLITEDYVLVYLHGATPRGSMPTFSWLKRCYQMIDRRLRKNLKKLYLVHPTFWLKTIVIMTRPFVSSKFTRKLAFVETLGDLADVLPLEQASLPDRVKQLDNELECRRKKPDMLRSERDKFGDTIR